MHRGFYHPPVVRRGAHPVIGYGAYDASKGYPQMRQSATDEMTGGAVSAVANSLAGKTYVGKDALKLSGGKRGFFDAGLDQQVRAFQSDRGLAADGIVGPQTYKRLGLVGDPAAVKPRSGGGVGGRAGGAPSTVGGEPTDGTGESITDKVWFWPVAILVPTAALVGGLLFWPK